MLCLMVSHLDYRILRQTFGNGGYKLSLTHLLYFLALGLQIFVLFGGQELNSAKRWIKIGPIGFQPSEISKIATIVFISYMIYRNRKLMDSLKGIFAVAVYIGPLIILIGIENMSSAIIVVAITGGMCFVASKKKLQFIIFILIGVAAGAAYIMLGEGFRRERIQIWLNVETNENAMQIRQGLYAIASGGLFGKGLGQSMQKLGYIPEAYNDMIFSVICEELGIVGACMVLIAFLVLFWRILFEACHAPDLFGTMLCAGVMIQFAVQVIINVAVVTNTIPSTGIPLPFISYGGTSEMIMMIEIGLVLSVSGQIKQK